MSFILPNAGTFVNIPAHCGGFYLRVLDNTDGIKDNFSMSRLSDTAHQMYVFIQEGLARNGKAPTIKELSASLKLSTRKTLETLRELEDSLIIKRSPYRSRAIEVVTPLDKETGKAKDTQIPVPILGTAPGGPFLFAEENREDSLMVSSRLVRGQTDVFLLRVVGNSMSPFLEDGDLALVKKQESPNERDIVVAVREGIDGYEVTIKKFHSDGNQIILSPLNTREAEPIAGTTETIKVQGIVIGAIKMFYDKQETQTLNSRNN
ncbi:MAG TPA: transcriptional repressor LexA [Candidatus Bathyarchaeia archaeon]|nr:transcriptional repressor LexA [Candidatus Bathyarchaeia archaeon]